MSSPDTDMLRPTHAQATVLIVEDSAIQAELLRRTVVGAGYRAWVARDGAEGLQMARLHAPDLVVSDITMPVMNGFELCRHLREDAALGRTPVILLTAMADARDVIRGINAGADCYVTKPYNSQILLGHMANLLTAPPQREQPFLDMSVRIDDSEFEVRAQARQLLRLLISTYQNAVLQNRELTSIQDSLLTFNQQLEEKVRLRTLELERANEALGRDIRERQVLEARLREEALHDPLTGLYNRRFLQATLEREASRTRRTRLPLGIIMLDIDHFKRINDKHGHAAGDQVLQWLGQFLRDRTRGEDMACRYGGEEFTLLIPGATLENAVLRAEQIRLSIQTLSRGSFTPVPIEPITVSLGVAAFDLNAMQWSSVDDTMQAADDALYLAKQRGRNRVEPAGPESLPRARRDTARSSTPGDDRAPAAQRIGVADPDESGALP